MGRSEGEFRCARSAISLLQPSHTDIGGSGHMDRPNHQAFVAAPGIDPSGMMATAKKSAYIAL